MEPADGQADAVKARAREARIVIWCQVRRRLWAAGFPGPEQLTGPAPLGALLAAAEAHIPNGTQVARWRDDPRLVVETLARVVAQ